MDCLMKTIKYVVVFFNFLCAVFGIVIVVLSALAMKELGAASKPICVSLIVFGCIILCISFVGCCGALTESLCCIWTYVLCLLVLLVSNVINIIYINKADSAEHARNDMNLAWQHMKEGSDVTMHMFQSTMECCGKTNYNDYMTAGIPIPISCYWNADMSPENLYQRGCLGELTDSYRSSFKRMYNFSWVVFAIEAASLVLAIALGVAYQLED
ncbi:protein late bloomer [Bactrocera dorsalis]|uniref:Tetraspanin n=1 Tax=Bactrocera dorsalis TaxID=27457 RepID=A0ABM3JGN5_BACDO|nr:protein late bloomer [Bactrocera dorsalis]